MLLITNDISLIRCDFRVASKTSTPVYIDNDILKQVKEFSKTDEGKKIAIKDPKKLLQYMVTAYMQEHS